MVLPGIKDLKKIPEKLNTEQFCADLSTLNLPSLSPRPLLLFLCFAKEKVTKRKATFFESLRAKKEALRCYVQHLSTQ